MPYLFTCKGSKYDGDGVLCINHSAPSYIREVDLASGAIFKRGMRLSH